MLSNLIKKYQAIRSAYMNRSRRGKWEFVRNIGIFVLTLTGVPVLDPSFGVFWYSLAPGLTGLDIFMSFFYTVWYFWHTNPLSGILVTPTFGFVIPVKIISYNLVNLFVNYCEMLQFLGRFQIFLFFSFQLI